MINNFWFQYGIVVAPYQVERGQSSDIYAQDNQPNTRVHIQSMSSWSALLEGWVGSPHRNSPTDHCLPEEGLYRTAGRNVSKLKSVRRSRAIVFASQVWRLEN